MQHAKVAIKNYGGPDTSVKINETEYGPVIGELRLLAHRGGHQLVIGLPRLSGIDVETWAKVRVDDETAGLLKSIGWTAP